MGSIRAPKLPGNGSKGARACRSGGSSSPRRGVNDTSGAPARPAPRGSPRPRRHRPCRRAPRERLPPLSQRAQRAAATGAAAAERTWLVERRAAHERHQRHVRRALRSYTHLHGAARRPCSARHAPLAAAPPGRARGGARVWGGGTQEKMVQGCPGRRARRSFRSRSRTRAHPQPAPPDAGPRVGASAAARRGREQAAPWHLDGARHLRRAPRGPTRRMSERPVAGSRIRPTCTAAGAARSPPAHLPPGTPPLRGTRRPGVRGNQGVEGGAAHPDAVEAARRCVHAPGRGGRAWRARCCGGSTGLRGRLAGQRCGHLGRRGSAGRGGGEARAPMGRGALSGISLCGRYGSSILRGAPAIPRGRPRRGNSKPATWV